jgi:hypothetical protein
MCYLREGSPELDRRRSLNDQARFNISKQLEGLMKKIKGNARQIEPL